MAVSPDHGKLDQSLQGVHVPYQWAYANAGARTGATGFVSTDVGKLARQTDNNTLWMLTAVTPTWVQIGTSVAIPTGVADAGISLVVDGGGAAITDSTKFFFAWPWSGTLTAWDLISDLSGNITFDVKDATYANFPGTTASIWGGSIPALAGAQKAQSSGLSIAITKGHWAEVVITGAATMTNCTLAVYITRS